jgi:hypothetical protein
MADKFTVSLEKWRAVLGLVLALITLSGSVWGATAWAIRYQVDQAVDVRIDEVKGLVGELRRESDIQHEGFVSTRDLDNARQLQELRLQAIERQLATIDGRLEWLVRREVERSGGRRDDSNRGGG